MSKWPNHTCLIFSPFRPESTPCQNVWQPVPTFELYFKLSRTPLLKIHSCCDHWEFLHFYKSCSPHPPVHPCCRSWSPATSAAALHDKSLQHLHLPHSCHRTRLELWDRPLLWWFRCWSPGDDSNGVLSSCLVPICRKPLPPPDMYGAIPGCCLPHHL